MKKNLIAFLILACFILSACGSSKSEVTLPQKKTQTPTSKIVAEPAVVEKPQFTRDNYPKVDGSTATITLSEDIAAAIIGLSKTQASEL